MNARLSWLVGLLMAAGLACSWAVAQQPPQPPQPAVAPVSPLAPGLNLELFSNYQQSRSTSKDQAQAVTLAKQYAKAEKDDEKKEIRKKLSEVLAKQFDQHVQQQQKELEDLEKQIASLRNTVKKRVDAKTAIVDFRLEQLIKEADGMGWNVPATPRQPVLPLRDIKDIKQVPRSE